MKKTSLIALSASVILLNSCANLPTDGNSRPTEDRFEERKEKTGKLFGDEFIIFGSSHKHKQNNNGSTISVNQYLWRGSLNILRDIPLQSADSVGGIIITDWYSPSNSKKERIKVIVYITTTYLKSEGLNVSVYKQELRGGTWVDVKPSNNISNVFENAILTDARKRYIKAKSVS